MGYANRKPRPANGNFNSRVLKPAKKKSHVVVWIGVVLLLLAAGGVALYLSLAPKSEVQVYRKAAKKGDADALPNSGRLHAKGKGIDKEKPKVDKSSEGEVQKYRKAAENGDVKAMVKLSEFYRGKDAHEEISWLYCIGMSYRLGDGVEKDMVKAVAWFRRAAEHVEQNHTPSPHGVLAMVMLGACYEDGEGVKKDAGEAVKWYRKAAEFEYLKESAAAMVMLGMCYENGKGVEKDAGKAVKLYWKAAEKGLATAMINLGNCYCTGEGVERDFNEAAMWWRKAEVFGSPDEKERAKKLLREVRSLLR